MGASSASAGLRSQLRLIRSSAAESAEALDSLGAGSQGDWVADLENEILLKQVIGAMEPRVREMFALRSAGHSFRLHSE